MLRPRPSRLLLAKVGACLFLAGALFILIKLPAARYLPEALPYLRTPKRVVVPVEGLQRPSLVSTWHAPRSGGRKHEGVDLFARRGTPVLASTHGQVWKVGWDRLGGNVVWVLGEGPALYYYAHLSSFAEGLERGDHVKPGTVLGTVGNTGNARRTPPHLHFGVYRLGWFGLSAVDPVPMLLEKGVFVPATTPLPPPEVVTASHRRTPKKTEPSSRTRSRGDTRPASATDRSQKRAPQGPKSPPAGANVPRPASGRGD